MRIFLIGLMALIIGLVACKKQKEFDKKVMLEGIITDFVLKNYDEAIVAVTNLKSAVEAFNNTPEQGKLEAAQNAWKETMNIWSKVEGLNFGPGRSRYRYLQLDNTPVRTNSIENALATTTLIDLAYIEQTGSYTKGLATVEYLLFGTGGDNAAVLQWYQTDVSASRRKDYLRYSVAYASVLLEELTTEWKETYGTELANLTDNSNLGGIARFSNALIHLSQTVARKKVGKPLGKESRTGSVQVHLVESPYAQYSWAMLHYNLVGLQELFGNEQKGLGSYLTHLLEDNTTTQKIVDQLEKVVMLTKDRTGSLTTELVTKQTEVEAIYSELKELYRLLTEEYLPYVSITLLTNPDDGD